MGPVGPVSPVSPMGRGRFPLGGRSEPGADLGPDGGAEAAVAAASAGLGLKQLPQGRSAEARRALLPGQEPLVRPLVLRKDRQDLGHLRGPAGDRALLRDDDARSAVGLKRAMSGAPR